MELITPNLGLVFWMTVSFSLVLFILGKFAWKPIAHTLKIREESIEEALKSAEVAKEEMAQMKSDTEQLLQEARTERDQVLKEAIAAANKIKDDAKQEAGKISGKMLEEARISIQNEKNAALNEVKSEVANISLEIAEKLLRINLKDDKSQKELAERFLKDVNIN